MARPCEIVLGLLLTTAALAAAEDAPHRTATFADELRFEAGQSEDVPTGWGGGPPETLHAETEIVHGGRGAGRVERDAESTGGFSALTRAIPVDFAGTTLALEGDLRSRDVAGWCGLWMRVDGTAGALAFDNMQDRAVTGTTDWSHYRIELPLVEGAREIYFGALLSGEGVIWVDDFVLTVDGDPVGETAVIEREPTVLELDTEFDEGSGIDVIQVTELQRESLALLCRVWGFLKYHHPEVTGGGVHWDYAFFRVLPGVLDAPDAVAAREAILAWADSTIGTPPDCDPCTKLPEEVVVAPDLAWLRDREGLGEALHDYLGTVYERRHAGGPQFFVEFALNVQNPRFDNELAYASLEEIDTGFRLLALFRYWNIIQYWFPYRDVIGSDWNDVLDEMLPRFVAATTRDDYRLALHALIARVNDTHANLWSSVNVRPPGGSASVAAALRPIEGRAVVYDVSSDEVPLEAGDVIRAVDGVDVTTLVEKWSPLYSASNDASRLRDIMRSLTRGDPGTCSLRIERGGREQDVVATRVSQPDVEHYHDHAGDAFQLLADDVAYLKLSAVSRGDAVSYVERAEGTRGLVIDIRNYPAEFMVFALGRHLVQEPTPFATFTKGDPANPGAFVWTDPVVLEPEAPTYSGRIAILVDETSQSQAEYTTMAFRVAPGAIVVGSTTSGADGNASWFTLPGRERSMISGIGVFYPDGTPTQRVGIVPDVEVRPTLEGFRAGRDEVLEAALRRLLGPDVPEERVIETARY